jgi:hypothetical protein
MSRKLRSLVKQCDRTLKKEDQKRSDAIRIKQIKSINELIQLAKRDKGVGCFIVLNGSVRSYKYIEYRMNKFYITNDVDDSNIVLTATQLMDTSRTHIGQAIKSGAFYKYS